jgi:hypothetical protein
MLKKVAKGLQEDGIVIDQQEPTRGEMSRDDRGRQRETFFTRDDPYPFGQLNGKP